MRKTRMKSDGGVPALGFKKNFAECVARHRALQAASHGSLICTHLATEDDAYWVRAPMPPLETMDLERDPLLMPRLLCDHAEKVFAARAGYPDDWIPFAAPRYGTGIVGGMLLGALEFGANTSWTHPVGATLDEAIDFPWGTENRWIDLVVAGLNYMSKRLRGKCFVFFEGRHAPLEWAAAVRGSGLYLDLAVEPEKVHRLLRRCDEALTWVYDVMDSRVERHEYGALAHSLWMERCVAFLSDDSAGLISPAAYAEFGAPYTDAMFARYGGGFLHIHTQAYHQMANLNAMEHLTMYNWRQDPNTRCPADILEQLLPGAQKKIVMIVLTPEEIRRNAHLLSQGRFLIYTRCTTEREQRGIIDFVKTALPIA